MNMNYQIEPVGFVTAARKDVTDDYWGLTESTITLAEGFGQDALAGLDEYSHVEVVFLFHRVGDDSISRGARHPRGNPAWPKVGIFAQRAKNRPNRIGCTICPILRVEGTKLTVKELDAVDGTPVLDLKPVVAEFLPRNEIRQPEWSKEMMARYWLSGE